MPIDNFGNFIPYPIYPNPNPNINYQQPQNNINKQNQFQQNIYAFVNGLEGAKSYMVPANQTVLLMDSEQPVCYMKSANALGQCSLRYFKLTETNENEIRELNNAQTKQSNDFVSRNEFESIIERIKKLEGTTKNE